MNYSREQFLTALDRLPTLPRIAYLLAAAEGYDHRQVAFILGRPLEEAHGHIADALFLLNRYLRENDPPR